jgi:hypothetical protein
VKAGGRAGEDRAVRRDDGAAFTSRVGGGNGRPPVLAIAFVAVLAAVVAVGLSGRSDAGSANQAGGGLPSAAAGLATPAVAGTTYVPRGPRAVPVPTPRRAPVVSSTGEGPIVLQIRRQPDSMYIHGDIYAAEVAWVFVNILDSEGRVAGWAQVSAPAGIGPRGDDVPTMRFDVEQALPDRSNGPLWVQAIVYAAGGVVIGTERLGVWYDGTQVLEEVTHGRADVDRGRPGVFFPRLDASWDDVHATLAPEGP